MADNRVIQCNFMGETASIARGARSYVMLTNPGGGNDRIKILVRSRSGRWISRWESLLVLDNFRPKVMAQQNPLSKYDMVDADSVYGLQLLKVVGMMKLVSEGNVSNSGND
jgi:hypothetical protein